MNQKSALQILKKTREDYNKIAEHFSKTRQKHIWPDIERFMSYVKSGDKILDVGCGNGRLNQLFSEINIDYTGVDVSEALVNEAKKQWTNSNIKFIVGDILNLGFPENNFNAIFCLAVLYHIPSQELRQRAMANLARVVRPGGHVFITIWNLWQTKFLPYIKRNNLKKLIGLSKLDFNDFFLPWKNQQGRIITTRYCHAFRQQELEDLIKNSGLKIIESTAGKNKYGQDFNFCVVAQK